MKEKYPLIRKIYLYVFSFVGLLLVVIGLVRLLDLGLKVYVFKKADNYVYYPPTPTRIEKDGTARELTEEEQTKYKKEQEEAQKQQIEAQRQSTASNSLAMIIIGIPLFIYHWKIINKESREN